MGRLRRHTTERMRITNPKRGERDEVGAEIIDECWLREPEAFAGVADTELTREGWRESAFVAQLLEWPSGERGVRITYYARPYLGDSTSWRFAGQYAPIVSLQESRDWLHKLQAKIW